MAGNREFQQIVAAAPRDVLKIFHSAQNVNIAAGAQEIIDFYASAGCIANVVSAYIDYPPPTGATTGTHSLGLTSTQQIGGYLSAGSNFGTGIHFNCKVFETADQANSVFPSSNEGQVAALVSTYFDDTTGLRLVYTNSTDKAQTGYRNYGVTYIERIRGN